MHIIISANTSWYIFNFRLTLMKAIIAEGHSVSVAAPEDAYSKRFAAHGIGFIPLALQAKGKNPLQELAVLFRYLKIYRTFKPDLVLHYTIKPDLYGSIAASFLGIPAVNNVTGLGAVFEKKNLLSAAVSLLYRFAFRKSIRVFFQNTDDRGLFLEKKLVKQEKTALLPGSGVNLEHFTAKEKEAGPFTFLFVGRLLKAKGVEDFIHAAEIVRAAGFKEIRFVLLGGYDAADPYMADGALLEKAKSSGLAEIPGPVDDVRVWLNKTDCVVLPSYYREGVPRSLLEACASGKTLIAADSIGTREPVIDGINGYLCAPRNPADLAAKMIQLFQLPGEKRREMGLNSRTRAETSFSERIVLNAYLEIVRKITVK